MAYLYEKIREKIGNQHDTASLQALLKARQSFYQGIEDTYNQELQTALQTATTEPQRQAAYQHAFKATNRIVQVPRHQLAKDQREAPGRRRRARATRLSSRRVSSHRTRSVARRSPASRQSRMGRAPTSRS
jgi:hypothetical protein